MTIVTWGIRLVLMLAFTVMAANCTMLGLNYSSLDTDNKPAPLPELAMPLDRSDIMATLEAELYGPWPGNLPVSASPLRMINADFMDGRGTLQELTLTIGEGDGARTFPVVLALPNVATSEPVPLLISQTFSENCAAFPGEAITAPGGAICDGSSMDGTLGFIARQIFGTYIAKVPAERYLEAGLGYATFYGSSFIPDANGAGQSVMANLAPGPAPTSTLMGWAFGFEAVAKTLEQDPRIQPDAIAAIGHSRFGKSALIAAAWSDHIDAAITHQSGFAGAASSRSPKGETLARMAKTYPHWLRPGLADDLDSGKDLTLDQHFLLALIAPKPIFLGNGRRDVWSDPNSTFRIAEAADTAYEAAGSTGLPDGGMRVFEPGADISYWLRSGGHSVVSRDIDAFIAFSLAHFGDTAHHFETALQTAQ